MSEQVHSRSVRRSLRLPTAVLSIVALSACAPLSHAEDNPVAHSTPTSHAEKQPPKTPEATKSALPQPSSPTTLDTHPTHTPTHESSSPTVTPTPNAEPTYQPVTVMPNGTPRFWPHNLVNTWYTSPWYKGAHPKMVGFGCTKAPYYDPDPYCPGGEGKHHGIDIEMPCGTPLYSDMNGVVVDYNAPGAPGPAYGKDPLRIRGRVAGMPGIIDVVIGHTRTDLVKPGDHVTDGQLISYASDDGAPDGCHEHFEVRPVGTSYEQAIDPAPYLKLTQLVTTSN